MTDTPWTPMEWTSDMSVGIAQLDDDHKGLIAIINRVGAAVKDDGGEAIAALPQTFRALRRYMQVHFAREEEAMRAAGYARYDEHRAHHKAFTDEIGAMTSRFETGGDSALLGDLAAYLRDWLATHIMVEDQAYKPYLAGNDRAHRAATEFSALGLWTG